MELLSFPVLLVDSALGVATGRTCSLTTVGAMLTPAG